MEVQSGNYFGPGTWTRSGVYIFRLLLPVLLLHASFYDCQRSGGVSAASVPHVQGLGHTPLDRSDLEPGVRALYFKSSNVSTHTCLME